MKGNTDGVHPRLMNVTNILTGNVVVLELLPDSRQLGPSQGQFGDVVMGNGENAGLQELTEG